MKQEQVISNIVKMKDGWYYVAIVAAGGKTVDLIAQDPNGHVDDVDYIPIPRCEEDAQVVIVHMGLKIHIRMPPDVPHAYVDAHIMYLCVDNTWTYGMGTLEHTVRIDANIR